MTLPATYASQLQNIQESPKFQPNPAGERQAVPFPGYTVITPPWEEDSENTQFYTNLKECQQQLQQQLDSGMLVPVPPSSFHLTVADLIWDSAYRHASANNVEFEDQLRSAIAEIFQQSQSSLKGGNPIRWQPLGLMVMPRALAVCLVPKDERSYERILQFRRAIYQAPNLMRIGIEQQYRFTAHITLGYFGEIPSQPNREKLSDQLSEFNDQWLETSQEILVKQAELRKFNDMTQYSREPDWPVFEF